MVSRTKSIFRDKMIDLAVLIIAGVIAYVIGEHIL